MIDMYGLNAESELYFDLNMTLYAIESGKAIIDLLEEQPLRLVFTSTINKAGKNDWTLDAVQHRASMTEAERKAMLVDKNIIIRGQNLWKFTTSTTRRI